MDKLSQIEPPLASNPANGINNIPLNGEQVEGVTKDQMRQLLRKIKSAKDIFDLLDFFTNSINSSRITLP